MFNCALAPVLESLETRRLFAYQMSINFAPDNTAAAVGYYTDIGHGYKLQSNGKSSDQYFGWIDPTTGNPVENTGQTFQRNSSASPDLRYDTGIGTKPSSANRTWEISVPDGTYYVRLVAGDASITSGSYKYNVEGTTNFVNGTATSSNRWIIGTGTVEVTDGRLTVSNGSSATNYKLAFIEITDNSARSLDTVNAPSDVDLLPKS